MVSIAPVDDYYLDLAQIFALRTTKETRRRNGEEEENREKGSRIKREVKWLGFDNLSKKSSYRKGELRLGNYMQDMIKGHTFGEMARMVTES